MQDIINDYCKNIIQPIEDERNKLMKKIYSKNIFSILYKKQYKELLKKYDDLWYKSLLTLEKMLEN